MLRRGCLRGKALFLRVASQHVESDDVTRCIPQVILVDEVKGHEELFPSDDHEKPERHGARHRAPFDCNKIPLLKHRVPPFEKNREGSGEAEIRRQAESPANRMAPLDGPVRLFF